MTTTSKRNETHPYACGDRPRGGCSEGQTRYPDALAHHTCDPPRDDLLVGWEVEL